MFTETFVQAWRERFGEEPPIEVPEVGRLLTHRSVRKYSDRPVPEELISVLIGVAQSAATSSNLQLWSIISIHDMEVRRKLDQICEGQEHVVKAPWLFAFVADHHRLKSVIQQGCEGLDYTEFYTMAIIDVALAAERMVCAAETLGLGICYIGAFRNNPEAVSELLGLPEGTFCPFGFCLGYPADDAKAEIKPRLRQDRIWFRDRYPASIDVQEYNGRMSVFHESQGMRGDVTWTMRSGRRTDNHHLTGREVLLDWLRQRGFLRR